MPGSERETHSPRSQESRTSGTRTVFLSRFLREGSLYFGLVVIFIVGWLADNTGTFLTGNNQRDVLRAVSQNGILAVGMTLVILTGGIDLSVGRMLGLASTLAAMLLVERRWTAATYFALPLAIAAAGILAALLLRRLLVKDGRHRLTLLVTAAGFLIGAALLGAWTIPRVSSGLSVLRVLVVVPLAGLMLGGLSGVIISKCRLQPFIVTLAMMTTAFGGARLIASAGGAPYIHPLYDSQGNVPKGVDGLRVISSDDLADWMEPWAPGAVVRSLRVENVKDESTGRVESRRGRLCAVLDLVPVPGLFFLACLAVGVFVLNRLRFGRYIYAIGGNEETARLSGINVDRVKIAVYAISGMLSFLAGVLACAQYNQGKPDMGQMGELDAIAAVVIGGTSLMGGRGRMMGTLVGVLIFGYLTNILSLRGVSTDVQLFITGIIIVGAVLLQEGAIQQLTARWRSRQRW